MVAGWVIDTDGPLFLVRMSSVLMVVSPTASACSLPSAYIATTAPSSASSSMVAPADVSPGHIISAPLKTNCMDMGMSTECATPSTADAPNMTRYTGSGVAERNNWNGASTKAVDTL